MGAARDHNSANSKIKREPFRHWPAVALGIVALGALAVLSLSQLLSGPAPIQGGPLSQQTASDHFSGLADPGADFSFGWIGLRNSEQEPAVIDGIEVADLNGITFLESYVVRADKIPYGVAEWPAFPPEGWENVPLMPAVGFAVPQYVGTPDTEYVLLLHLKLAETKGAHSFDGIGLDYHVGSSRYRINYRYGIRECVPRDAWVSCGAQGSADPVEVSPAPQASP